MAEYPGLESIGTLIGGRKALEQNAFDEGRLRTAKTEYALSQAKEKQLEAKAKAAQERELENIGDTIAQTGDPNAPLITAFIRAGRGNSQQMMGAMLGGQEYGQRNTLADPDAPIGDQFAAGQGVQGKVLPKLAPVGEGNVLNLLDEEPTLTPSPVGESTIQRNVASARLSDERRTNPSAFRSTTATGPGGVKAPSGFVDNPNFDPELPEDSKTNPRWMAGTGGPQDPNTPGKLGVRERQVVGRVTNAAFNTANDLENLMSIPTEASTGFLGTGMGAAPSVSVLDATAGQLKYAISPDEVRDYQRILSGLSRQMLALEAMGMAGTQQMAESYDSLMFRNYDTIEDKMMALALMRQTTENGLRTLITINPLSEDSKAELQRTIDRMAAAVPFTVEDVLALRYGKRETLGSAIQGSGITPAAAPAAAAPEPALPQDGDRELDEESGIEYEYGGGPDGDRADPANWYPVVQ